jgi:hypothetical protein
VITPSALNVLIIGLSVLVFSFLWRTLAMQWSERPIGQAMATLL